MNTDEILEVIIKERDKINKDAKSLDREITIDDSLKDLGLSSMEVVQLLLELEEIYDIEFSEKVDTIFQLVTFVDGRSKVSERG